MPAPTRKSPEAFSPRPWEIPAASLLCLALAAAITWPLLARPGSGAHDETDTLFNTWLMAWNFHAAASLSNPLAPPIFLGQPDASGRNDLLFVQSLAAVPLRIAGASPLAAHNIVFVLSLAFAGLALYLLGREVGLDPAGSLFAAGAFVCSPFFQSHLWHIQLQSAGLSVLGIRQAVRAARGDAAWPLSVLVFLQFAASLYYGLFLDAALLLALPWVIQRRGGDAMRYAGWVLAGNLFVIPLLLGTISNAHRWPADTMTSTDVSAFVSPWNSSRLTGPLRPPSTLGEAALWPGLASVAGAVAHLARKNRSRSLEMGWFLALICVFFAVFSLGPTLVVFGRQVSAAPFRLLAGLPGFSSVRLPARAGFLFLLPVFLSAGFAMRRRPLLAAAGIALSFAEVWPGQMRLEAVQPPPFHDWLARRHFHAIAILPLGTSLDRPESECSNLYGSTLHFTPMVNGYSTSLPQGYERTAATLNTWPSPAADSLLDSLGVQCLICKGWVAEGADTVWEGPRPVSAVVLP